ncbi:MAG: LacI family DNA-binding transcriptional regulator [Mycetocola sp.]
MRRATLDDIARKAGVSISTVSKVLNRRTGFSEDTRERVEQAMAELDYAPITRDRAPGVTGAVVVIFDTLYTLYSLRVLEGVAEAAQAAGVDLITQVADPGHHGVATLTLDARRVASMSDKGHAGVVMVTSRISAEMVKQFRDRDLPLVSIDASALVPGDVPNVGSNHWRGGVQAATHLRELGHTQIGFIGGDPDNPGLRERLSGFREVLARDGVSSDPALVSEEGMDQGPVAFDRMMSLAEPPTAVFASTDAGAMEILALARDRGLRVPEDLSVIGYDDTYSLVAPSLGLTTVRAPLEAVGKTAVETVLGLAAGRPVSEADLYLSTRLVVRSTTAPPSGVSRLDQATE